MLDKKTLSQIKKIIFQYLDYKKDKVFIFGSRAIGKSAKFSDIDIGIESKRKIPSHTLSEIKEEFEQSDIPYIVEVVDFSSVSTRFNKVAKQKIVSLN